MVRPSPLSMGVREQCIVNGVTVFDTNAYQGLSSGLLDALIASERRDGIVAYADPSGGDRTNREAHKYKVTALCSCCNQETILSLRGRRDSSDDR